MTMLMSGFYAKEFIRDNINEEASKEHWYFSNFAASWSSMQEMLSNMPPSVLDYADTMRITVGKHAILELMRFHIPDSYFGRKG